MSKAWRDNFPSLRSWDLQNFKSVVKAELKLAPLTLVVGANSAGKSSLLQSILLMAQASAETTPGSFPLNGPLVGLGAFAEARSDFKHGSGDLISVGGSLALPDIMRQYHFLNVRVLELGVGLADQGKRKTAVETLTWDVSLGKDPESNGAVVHESAVTLSRDQSLLGRLSAFPRPDDEDAPPMMGYRGPFGDSYKMTESLEENFDDDSGRPRRSRRMAARAPIQREFGAVAFSAGVPVDGLCEMDESTWFLDTVEEYSLDFVPPRREVTDEALDRPSGSEPRDMHQAAADRLYSLLEEKFRLFITSLRNGVAPDFNFDREFAAKCSQAIRRPEYPKHIRPAVLQRLTSDLPEPRLILAPLRAEGMRNPASFVPQYFRDWVLYLGPLREDPRVTYPHSIAGSTHMPLGRKGESTASVLLQSSTGGRRSAPVGAGRYPLPDDQGTSSLQESVGAWVKEFGLGETLYVGDQDRYGVAFTIDRRDLTSVGTGVSQILPVMVLCLKALPGQLVLLEQPELHLNPALQQKLADFFLAMVRSGRQLIVETHSEYVVTRLRLRVAEDEKDEVRNLFNIVFTEQDEKRQTNFRVLDVDESGALGVDDWPVGFFDQAGNDVEAIMRLALNRLKRDAEV
jgi:predicted ATPase